MLKYKMSENNFHSFYFIMEVKQKVFLILFLLIHHAYLNVLHKIGIYLKYCNRSVEIVNIDDEISSVIIKGTEITKILNNNCSCFIFMFYI